MRDHGNGNRPTPDGGTNNHGAGEKCTTTKNAAGEDLSASAPEERMQDKASDAEGAAPDASADFNLHEALTPSSSKDENER